MAVLSNIDFSNEIKEDGEIIILNKSKENMTAVGYDFAIGFICDSATGKKPKIYKKDTNRYILLSGHRYLVISKEFLYLPPKYMATLHSRISYALKGILITSTTIDPNYIGFVMGTLFNCTSEDIYIKKDKPFVTMVVHEFRTPTETYLAKDDQNLPKDALATLYSKYPNIHKKARDAAFSYWTKAKSEIECEFETVKERLREKWQRDTVSLPEDKWGTRITFLIGNGFDLNVGLDTRYQDFYKYYIGKRNNLLSKKIEKNRGDWSDLELALGECTKGIKDKKEFWKCERDLEICLLDYLEEQMKRVDIADDEKQRVVGHNMFYSLRFFYEKFSSDIKSKIQKMLSAEDKQVEYAFITFNYTDTLEKCLKALESQHMEGMWSEIDKKVLHIHGTTKNRDIVLGVNDESQIVNEEYRNNSLDRRRFIKREIIEHNGNTIKEDVCRTIDRSSIICIFGMSIGETDREWWHYIGKWLQDDENRMLIIFEKDFEEKSINKYFAGDEDKVKNKFKYNGELSSVWEKIEEQIYVKMNAEIFNFKVV